MDFSITESGKYARSIYIKQYHSFKKIQVRRTSYHGELNKEFVKVTFEPYNDTHLGAIYLEVYKEITNGFVRAIVKKPDRKYIDSTVDVCKWLTNPRINFLITIFENYVKKHSNPELFKCPLKKGNYTVIGTREIVNNPDSYIPTFIPMIGKISVTVMAKTLVNKKFVSLCNVTETFEFY